MTKDLPANESPPEGDPKGMQTFGRTWMVVLGFLIIVTGGVFAMFWVEDDDRYCELVKEYNTELETAIKKLPIVSEGAADVEPVFKEFDRKFGDEKYREMEEAAPSSIRKDVERVYRAGRRRQFGEDAADLPASKRLARYDQEHCGIPAP